MEPPEPAIVTTLKSGQPSPSAPQMHYLEAPETHPEWLAFHWSLRAFGLSELAASSVWRQLLHGVKLQEEMNAQIRAHRLSGSGPHPLVHNGPFEQVAQGLGHLLRVEAGHGPMALWVGGYDVATYAQLKGYTTVDATRAGRALSRLELYKDAWAVAPLAKYLAKEFVRRNPEGEAHVFLKTHDPDRALFRRELPAVDKSAPWRPTTWHPVSSEELEAISSWRELATGLSVASPDGAESLGR